MFLRRAAVVIAAPLLALAASCGHSHHDDLANCDFVDHRCRTVCDEYCDGWGCYPDCYDQCWDECGYYPRTPAPIADASPPDAATPPDAGPPPPSGNGVLCSPCGSNSDCQAGALCIVRGGSSGDGGADAGASGFCGSSCQSVNDCPQGFSCVQIGAARQCLPTSASCQ